MTIEEYVAGLKEDFFNIAVEIDFSNPEKAIFVGEICRNLEKHFNIYLIELKGEKVWKYTPATTNAEEFLKILQAI